MNATILGLGWVTPLGRDLQAVSDALLAGGPAPALSELPGRTPLPVYRVPAAAVTDAESLPRLRRSSAISHFAVAAAVDATKGMTQEQLARTALVYVSSDGGVFYTRRFYDGVVAQGPGSGSPLLFPETVYNAPASHIAARLQLSGEALTLVGNVEMGLDAIQVGCELLACGDVDYCLVTAAQELDWITGEAYSRSGFASKGDQSGAVLSEGSAAVLLGLSGSGCRIETISSGTHRQKQPGTHAAIASGFPTSPACIISSHSGTNPGREELENLHRQFPKTLILLPKTLLGEALACSSLQQVVLAAFMLQSKGFSTIATYATGFNGRISALFLTESSHRA